MSQVVIENPIINSPYEEPARHFRFDDNGITEDIVSSRRESEYFIPVPPPRQHNATQLVLDNSWREGRLEKNDLVNRIRERVALWRKSGYQSATITSVTRRLLEYWQRTERLTIGHRLFFCQIEALETVIYLTEAAKSGSDVWIDNTLRDLNASSNSDLFRMAFKMATGSGKTVVMAMLIAWHTLNKIANPQDARFSDAFLIVTPGITVRDRLRVLQPSDPQNYYKAHDIVPPDLIEQIGRAKIVITNRHSMQMRERIAAGKLTKGILQQNVDSAGVFTETPGQMVKRVCRELGNKRNIIVINDEAHHCYRRKVDDEEEHFTGEERREVEERNKQAAIWINGLEAIKKKIGVRTVYDLSATPFFLRGSGYSKLTPDGRRITEGVLFPWVISDFSLIDAIECGIVKVPRVPVEGTNATAPTPMFRDLWPLIREQLPKRARTTVESDGTPLPLPSELEGALQSLYFNYEKAHDRWEKDPDAKVRGILPPVFIIVCSNTTVSKMVYDYVAGYTKKLSDDSTRIVPGKLALFSNVKDGRWITRPTTILVDSEQLESGEGLSDDFKQLAALEIEEFKSEYQRRFPGRDGDSLKDEDLLREVMNTVGKPGKLGEPVKCVVSVSMLTEGWDVNTVTHILGVRAFGTQLLCEQVVGRGLRRMNYSIEDRTFDVNGETVRIESFTPEYAEVYGVPFSFLPCAGSAVQPKVSRPITNVRALPERRECEIKFPRLVGYRYEFPSEKLDAKFTFDSGMMITAADVETKVLVSGIAGESVEMTLDKLRDHREQEIDFTLASRILERNCNDAEGNTRPWLFPQLVSIARRWRLESFRCGDNTFPQLLLFGIFTEEAVQKIYRAIVRASAGEKRLIAILSKQDPVGTTVGVGFDTSKPTYRTAAEKCHVSHVVLDSSWEAQAAQTLEDMPEVSCYVKNVGLSFSIPYTYEGRQASYFPDFIVKLEDGHGHEDLLNLIIEISGEPHPEKPVKASTAQTLWVPAVNNNGEFGRWAYVELVDPYNIENDIRAFLAGEKVNNLGPLLRQ